VSRKRLLDSFALLAYLNKETNFERVKQILANVQKSGDSVLMNEINIGETYCILFRKRGTQQAEYFLDTIPPGLPITPVSNNFQSVSGFDTGWRNPKKMEQVRFVWSC